MPKNIPYVVDNLWAWARPEQYADRRFCAYGSRTIEEASKYGKGDVYRIEFLGQHTICQLRGYGDAKNHPDVERKAGDKDKKPVKQVLFDMLGKYDWSNQSVDAKKEVGCLYIPVLDVEEVEDILTSFLTAPQRETLKEKIDFWDDVVVNPDEISEDGEIFFEYPGCYRLRTLE